MKQKLSADNSELTANGYAWLVLFILCLASIISFIDRQVINLLVDPIKDDLGISDTQISLLQGLAFSVFYAGAAIPLGRMVDIRSRKLIIASGIALWSLATAACGLARNFITLFIGRMFVGVGEATLTPGSFSMLADYFPRKSLTRALSIFNSSAFVGNGVALIIGGLVFAWIANMDPIIWPLLGEMSSWQLTFIIVALPGFFITALLLLVVREPKRTGSINENTDEIISLRETWAYFLNNSSVLAPIIFGTTLLAMSLYSVGAWTPAFYGRKFGMAPEEIGPIFGMYFVVLGSAGVIAGGMFADWLKNRGQHDSNIKACLISVIVTIPFLVTYPLVDDRTLSLVLLAPVIFFGTMTYGAGPTALPLLVPNRLRGQIMGLYILIVNLLGQGLGPSMVALFTDYVLADPQLVGFSISIVCSTIFVACAIVFAKGRKKFAAEIQRREAV